MNLKLDSGPAVLQETALRALDRIVTEKIDLRWKVGNLIAVETTGKRTVGPRLSDILRKLGADA